VEKEKLLITGGSGFLGSNIALMVSRDFEVFAAYNSHPHRLMGCTLLLLDIRDKGQVLSVFKEIKPDLVIHTAALVDVDYCEGHYEEAFAVNVDGARNVALASKGVGAKMVYISSDSVFDGGKGMYAEEDVPCPINIYAKTKIEGEKAAQDLLPDCIVVRTAFYGWHPISSSTLSLAEWIVSGLREGRILSMFTDVFFSPIFVNNLVEVLLEMHHSGLNGVYHLGGARRCSKFEFGQEIAKAFGLNKDYIQPSDVAKASLKAPRPRDISLDIGKISQTGNIHMRLFDFEDGVALFRGLEHSLGGGSLYL